MITITCIITGTAFVVVVVIDIIDITISFLFDKEVTTSMKNIIDFGSMNNIIIEFD